MKVVIATPSHNGKVSVEYLESLIGTIAKGKEEGIDFIPQFICGDSIIQSARNRSFAHAFEHDPDSMIWIDSDMEWKPEWAIKFAKSELDVLAGPCVKKSMVQHYNIAYNADTYTIDENGIMDIVGAGTGFLKMSRKAMDYLWENSEPYDYGTMKLKSVFEIKVINGKLTGEDIFVCLKLSEGGFKLYADTNFTVNHLGTHTFVGDFRNHLEDMKRVMDKESEKLAKELGLI